MTAIDRAARQTARRVRWYKLLPQMWYALGALHQRNVAFVHLEWRWWITGQLTERLAEGVAPTFLDAQRASDEHSVQRLQNFEPIWQGYSDRIPALNPKHRPKRYVGPDISTPDYLFFWSCESLDVSSCVGRDGRWSVGGLPDYTQLYVRGQAADHHAGIVAAEAVIRSAITAEIAAIQDPQPAPVIPTICHNCRRWWRWWPDCACACGEAFLHYHDLRTPCDVCAPLFTGAEGAANLAACRILGEHQYGEGEVPPPPSRVQ